MNRGHWRSQSAKAAVVSWNRAANIGLHSCCCNSSLLGEESCRRSRQLKGGSAPPWKRQTQTESVLKWVKKPQLAIWLSKAWGRHSWATGLFPQMRHLRLLSAAANHDLFMPKVTLKGWEASRTQGGELVFLFLSPSQPYQLPTAKPQELARSRRAQAPSDYKLATAFITSHMFHTP